MSDEKNSRESSPSKIDGCEGSLVEKGESCEQIDATPLQAVLSCIEKGEPATLVTITRTSGSAPRGLGTTMAVFSDGSIKGTVGGGNLELFAIRHALDSMEDGRARSLHYDFSGGKRQNVNKACRGTTDFLIQPFGKPSRLVVFGAGHVCRSLAPMGVSCGFTVSVADDRKEYLNPESFPKKTRFYHGPFSETAAEIPMDASTFVVVMTYGHAHDETVLNVCLERPWRYLGLMGSRSKIATIKKRIASTANAKKRFDQVNTPVGLDLGGRTPAEIAVSIMAEILAVKYERTGGMLKHGTRRHSKHTK